MQRLKLFIGLFFLCGSFFSNYVLSQHKFELGVSLDPLIVPINTATFIESGPGYYDIRGRRKVSQAGSAHFSYWPLRHVGISVGAHIRTFASRIDYAIPDVVVTIPEPMIEGSHPFTAHGWGPSLSVMFRKDRWKGQIGIAIFELENQKYTPKSVTTIVSTFIGGKKIADIEVREEAYWPIGPTSFDQIQFEAQYNIIDHLFVKVGFETSLYNNPEANYYTLHISGFTPQTSPGNHVFNDFQMRSSITSVYLGVGYALGFGRYRIDRDADAFD